MKPNTANYTNKLDWEDEDWEDEDQIMIIDKFVNDCLTGDFIDYDGFGHPMKDGLFDGQIYIYPSNKGLDIPQDATHIIWYNK